MIFWLSIINIEFLSGKPRPKVTWWHGNKLLDGVVDTSSNSFTTVNQLIISHLSRDFKGSRLECRATSSEVDGYIIRSIPLVVYCEYLIYFNTYKKNLKLSKEIINFYYTFICEAFKWINFESSSFVHFISSLEKRNTTNYSKSTSLSTYT